MLNLLPPLHLHDVAHTPSLFPQPAQEPSPFLPLEMLYKLLELSWPHPGKPQGEEPAEFKWKFREQGQWGDEQALESRLACLEEPASPEAQHEAAVAHS